MSNTQSDWSIGDWSPAEFERHGIELLHHLREYFDTIRDRPVAATTEPVSLRSLFDTQMPEGPEPFSAVLADTWDRVIPHLTLWHHPSFHGYFSNSSSFPAILAETLTAALNVNAMLWQSGPAASALEELVLRWIAQMIGYPTDADGVLVNGASLGSFYALAAARDALPGLSVREAGLAGRDLPALRVYASDQAHNSIDKAAIALGFGLQNVVRVDSDTEYRMKPAALKTAIERDRNAGRVPVAVVATVGTTATGAIDPLPALSEICSEHRVWLHVDAAYGGFWRLVPELAPAIDPLSVADSIVVNPHKCLFTPLEVTALYTRRKDALANTFRLVPEFLRTTDSDQTVDFMDHSLQLGRSFRALKLWWVIRSFGRAGLVNRLSYSAQLARSLRERIEDHPDWRSVTPSALPLICLRYVPRDLDGIDGERHQWARDRIDTLNARILADVNRSGLAFLSHTVLRDGYVLRVSIGNIQTTAEDIDRLWDTLNAAAARCTQEQHAPAPPGWPSVAGFAARHGGADTGTTTR